MPNLHECAFCGADCDGSYPYVLGQVRGHLCREHGKKLDDLVTEFVAGLIRDERRERERARKERLAAIKLAAEAYPLATRRATRRKGEAA